MYQSNLLGRICLEHPEMRIILICLNEKCQTNRLLCAKCTLKHSSHADKLYDINILEQSISPLITECNTILECYNIPINNIISNINQLKKIITIKQSIFMDHLNDEIGYFDKTCRVHNNDILMICREKACYQNKYVCCQCTNNHQNHCLLDKKIFKLIQKKMMEKLDLKQTKLKNLIDNLSQLLAQFNKRLNEKYQITAENFVLMNNKNVSFQITLLQNFVDKNQQDLKATIMFFDSILKQMDLCSFQIEHPINQMHFNRMKLVTLFQQIENLQDYQSQNLKQNMIEGFEKTIIILGKRLEESRNCQYLPIYKGNVLRELKFYAQSLYWYDQEIKSNCQSQEALFSKGIALKKQKKYQESLECFHKVLSIEKQKSKRIEALCEKGDCLYFLQNYKEALSVYEQVLAKQRHKREAVIGKGILIIPNNEDALKGKGEALSMLGKYQESIEWFDKALTINPNNEQALYGKGESLMILGNFQESIEWFDKTLVINPNNDQTLRGKGQDLGMLDKCLESIEQFDKALAINPKYQYALVEKAQVLTKLGKLQESIEWFDKALANNPNYDFALWGKGQALRMLKQYQESIYWFDKALAIDPKDYYSLEGKGETLRILGKFSESIEWLDKSLAINPNYQYSLWGKACALSQLGKYQESIEWFDKVLAINPHHESAQTLKAQARFNRHLEQQQIKQINTH